MDNVVALADGSHAFPRSLFGHKDTCLTDGLTAAVETLLPALEQFTQFDIPEQAGAKRAEWTAILDEPLPIAGHGAEVVLATLRDVIVPNGSTIGAPGFSGWVGSMPTTVPSATALAATLAGPNRIFSHSFNFLETIALRWLAELFDIPSTYQGVFVSGGSTANLVGLGAARQHAAERLGLDAARDGVATIPHPRIYASSEIHHTAHRAAGVLGLGRHAVVSIPTDATLRMDLGSLKHRLQQDLAAGYTPVAIVGVAGSTNTGAIDPLPELAALCREYHIWFHVDGAYGLPGILDPQVAHLYGMLADVDSLAVDPHKWLAAPVGCGAVFVRDAHLLQRAFTEEPADYLEGANVSSFLRHTDATTPHSQYTDYGPPFHHFAVEHSAPSRGALVWAILKEIGVDGMRARIQRDNAFARHLAQCVQSSPVLELMAPVTLSICCFRYVPPALRSRTDAEALATLNQLNRAILHQLWNDARCVPSGTFVHGAFVIRPCYVNPRTTIADVDALVEDVETLGAELWARVPSSE
ncbi:MAG: Aromatic-L-amino-acid decarboxylase [Ktedonobacterales bacterium]|nr:MAG: Aromatic-L-amino-acid decarboxylase [Ktedonobacterales bacterium]